MRLYGKRASEEEFAREVSRLLLGDPLKRTYPLPVSHIARTLGYTRETIYRYIRKAVKKYHLLEYDDRGRIVVPNKPRLEFQRFDKNHNDILQDPLVSDWKQDLMTRNNGEPISTWKASHSN